MIILDYADYLDYYYSNRSQIEVIRNRILLAFPLLYFPYPFWDKLNILTAKIFGRLL